ncbi:MAG TPA: GtrA family protein [Acidimicrobiia bacterium]
MHATALRSPTLLRALRCLLVSAATTLLSSLVLVALAVGLGLPAGLANIVGFGCGVPVSYVANRRWVWRRRGPSDPVREVGAFWAMNVAGLLLSTVAVAAAGALTASWPAGSRAVALPAASATSLGLLWVAQFVLLERVIFRTSPNVRQKSRVERLS